MWHPHTVTTWNGDSGHTFNGGQINLRNTGGSFIQIYAGTDQVENVNRHRFEAAAYESVSIAFANSTNNIADAKSLLEKYGPVERFSYKTTSDGKKSGFGMHPMILRTFAKVVMSDAFNPDASHAEELLESIYAVRCALYLKTGETDSRNKAEILAPYRSALKKRDEKPTWWPELFKEAYKYVEKRQVSVAMGDDSDEESVKGNDSDLEGASKYVEKRQVSVAMGDDSDEESVKSNDNSDLKEAYKYVEKRQVSVAMGDDSDEESVEGNNDNGLEDK
ncbi:hypothetical protein BT96DRAFT_975920 [Gymnopus androsaceus JB14]|uniref:Uncharacterized protein n=1 Tax=Gymnopus androsaceus JB14 TaxID=1447944 RepID=A0A6A4HP26_9AGAR|nr:hypothetical protein BT96DRAFT_975920 [Gymnopus androsaceus JB14]